MKLKENVFYQREQYVHSVWGKKELKVAEDLKGVQRGRSIVNQRDWAKEFGEVCRGHGKSLNFILVQGCIIYINVPKKNMS